MDEKRQKLLNLLEKLKFPMLPKEAEETISKMSDDDVDYLIEAYSDVDNYENVLDDYVRSVDPEGYDKLSKEYRQKLAKIKEDNDYKMEKIQEEEDVELDALESKAEREMEEKVSEQEKDVDEVVQLGDDLYSTLNESSGEGSAPPSE